MDPLGFALENFDTVGQFHAVDPQTRLPIDTKATLPDGTEIAGPEDLHKALAARVDQFAQIITEKLMTYAVGRHVEYRDMPAVRQHRAGQCRRRLQVRGHRAGRGQQRGVPPPRSPRSAACHHHGAGVQYHFHHTFRPLPEGWRP